MGATGAKEIVGDITFETPYLLDLGQLDYTNLENRSKALSKIMKIRGRIN